MRATDAVWKVALALCQVRTLTKSLRIDLHWFHFMCLFTSPSSFSLISFWKGNKLKNAFFPSRNSLISNSSPTYKNKDSLLHFLAFLFYLSLASQGYYFDKNSVEDVQHEITKLEISNKYIQPLISELKSYLFRSLIKVLRLQNKFTFKTTELRSVTFK